MLEGKCPSFQNVALATGLCWGGMSHQGHTQIIITGLQQQMMQASQELRFDDAACLRDAIQVLQNQQKESAASAQSHNLAGMNASRARDPISHTHDVPTFELKTDILNLDLMSTNSGETLCLSSAMLRAKIDLRQPASYSSSPRTSEP